MQLDPKRREFMCQRFNRSTNKGSFAWAFMMRGPLRIGRKKTCLNAATTTRSNQRRIVFDAKVAAKPDELFQGWHAEDQSDWMRRPRDASSWRLIFQPSLVRTMSDL